MYEWKPKAIKRFILTKHLLQFLVILFYMFSMTNSSTKRLVASSSVLSPANTNHNALYYRHKNSNTKQDHSFGQENKLTTKKDNIQVSSSTKNNTHIAVSPINPRRGKQLFPSMPGYVIYM